MPCNACPIADLSSTANAVPPYQKVQHVLAPPVQERDSRTGCLRVAKKCREPMHTRALFTRLRCGGHSMHSCCQDMAWAEQSRLPSAMTYRKPMKKDARLTWLPSWRAGTPALSVTPTKPCEGSRGRQPEQASASQGACSGSEKTSSRSRQGPDKDTQCHTQLVS